VFYFRGVFPAEKNLYSWLRLCVLAKPLAQNTAGFRRKGRGFVLQDVVTAVFLNAVNITSWWTPFSACWTRAICHNQSSCIVTSKGSRGFWRNSEPGKTEMLKVVAVCRYEQSSSWVAPWKAAALLNPSEVRQPQRTGVKVVAGGPFFLHTIVQPSSIIRHQPWRPIWAKRYRIEAQDTSPRLTLV